MLAMTTVAIVTALFGGVAMTTDEKRCDWWSVLLGDDELFTNIHLPAHVTDGQFISLLQQVSLSFLCVQPLRGRVTC